MGWFKKSWLYILIIGLLIINGSIIYNQIIQRELDLAIRQVQCQEISGEYHYKVNLHSTQLVSEGSDLVAYYVDGSHQVFSDILKNVQAEQVEFTSTVGLEHLLLANPESIVEKNLENNRYNIDVWSKGYKLLESYSVPDYDYIVDDKGRFWLVSTVKQTKEGFPSVILSVFEPDGDSLINKLQLNTEPIYAGHPILKQFGEEVHILWSSYRDEKDFLVHTYFSEQAGQLVQGDLTTIKDENRALIWPIFISSPSPEPVIMVLGKLDTIEAGFVVYQIKDHNVVKVKDLTDLVAPEDLLVDFDYSLLAEYGIELTDFEDYATEQSKSDSFKMRQVTDYQFVKDSDGNYVIVWADYNSWATDVSLIRLDKEFNVQTPQKDILKLSTRMLDTANLKIDLNLLVKEDKLVCFFLEVDNVVHGFNQLAVTVHSNTGEQIGEKQVITVPTPLPLSGVTVYPDDNGNYNVVWSDYRIGSSIRPNRELAFQTLDSNFKPIHPVYNLSNDLIGQLDPKLKIALGYRYLTWQNYKDGMYQLYFKTNEPVFREQLYMKTRIRDGINKLYNSLLLAILSLGAQVLFLIPLNLFPIAGVIIVISLFIFHKIGNRWKDWIGIFLFILLLKFMIILTLGKVPLIVQDSSMMTALIISLVVFISFLVVFMIKPRAKFESKVYYVLGWLAIDSFIHTLVYYVTTIN